MTGFLKVKSLLDAAKKREPTGSRFYITRKPDYMFAMIASPNSEHFSSLAPSIRRSKS